MDKLSKFSEKDLKKILAILTLSDGHLYIHKGKPRTIRLVTSISGESQHIFFKELSLKIFNKKIVTRKKTYENGKETIISDLNYREGVSKLLLLSQTYKTTPGLQKKEEYLKGPQPTISFLNDSSKELKWFCLRTYFDFDGSISPSLKLKSKKDDKGKKVYHYYQVQLEIEIKISETNPSLMEELLSLCESLELKARMVKDKRNWSNISGICISHHKSVEKFLEYGGPVTDVLISSKSENFKGVSKKELCERLLGLLNNKSISFSKSFHTKIEAETYRESIRKIVYQ